MVELSAPERSSDQFVQSLARGLAVIEVFGGDRPELTLSEVAAVAGISRAAARRSLLTLVELGYARQHGDRFALTPQVLRLGTAYLSGLDLPGLAQPHLEALSVRVEESANAAVLDGTDIVYVARVATRRIMAVGITIGTRFPAHATSLGHALLAGLSPERLDDYFAAADLVAVSERTVTDEDELRRKLAGVRKRGYAYADQELAPGLRSIAAPVCDGHGTVVAAINVSSTTARNPVKEFAEPLQTAARAITNDLTATTLH